MVASTYDDALRRLLVHEGGFTDHPSDPGGPTNFGITIHDYRKYVKPDATTADVRAMRLDEAKAIYRSKYWDALRCDDLPAGVDYAVFEYGVNSGIGRSGKVLRRVLGLDDNTHRVTDAVIAAVKARGAADVVAAICDERLAFLRRLKTWPVFGKGWGRRVAEVRGAALKLARPVSGKPAAAKKAATAAAAAAAGAVVATHQAQTTGPQPFVIAAIVVGAVALAALLAWGLWRWRRSRHQSQQEA
jgi:lysozyme family protein